MKSTDLISVFCRPVPFWSWNDKLEPDELRRQIGAMQDAGMGGFFMHARGGLETEYLSEDWFRAVEASVDEAKKRGMQAWCYRRTFNKQPYIINCQLIPGFRYSVKLF